MSKGPEVVSSSKAARTGLWSLVDADSIDSYD